MSILDFNNAHLSEIPDKEMFVDSLGNVVWRVVPSDAHAKELNPELWRFDVVSKARPDMLKPVGCDLLAPNVSPDFFDAMVQKFPDEIQNEV